MRIEDIKAYVDARPELTKIEVTSEIDEFNRIGQIENILKLSDMLHKKMNKGTLILPRLTVGNSLLLFLLEITNVNPLPRYHTVQNVTHSIGGINNLITVNVVENQ